MLSSDIGSLPARKDLSFIWKGSKKTNSLLPFLIVNDLDIKSFKEEIVSSFIDKLKAGVDIPNYPQFRDMNEMYFTLLSGFEKTEKGLVRVKTIKAKSNSSIPEVKALKLESSKIHEVISSEKIMIKICVTGPYTLASFFQSKTSDLFDELGKSISSILENSLFDNKKASIYHVSIDEPVLGFMNDPLLDYGSDARQSLKNSWERIALMAARHGIETSMHLHNTSENLVWDIEHLDVIASHVGDPLYVQESTKKRLEETDKKLWASIGITQFDTLIQNYLESKGIKSNIPEKIGNVWTSIKKGDTDPYTFLEDKKIMKKRLEKIVHHFGAERISISSPECGLNSFPRYDVAIECLRRTSEVVSNFNKTLG